ncbi:unannotated protein [freshwater metagenome]|uniref:Unannotated protein n=1 Tax=freshwater metagenome TaxID=449393 RepID=A0A6J7FKC9_9ZZZZ|nr:hypothetical protein [Actinomycetota bacterium]
MSTPRQQHGASPVGTEKKGGAWWKWLLALLLLLLVILAIVLIASGGDDEETDTASTSTAAVPAATTPAQAATPASTTATSTSEDAGTLTADGRSLLGTDGKTGAVDKDATGKSVKVLSVTDGGFFVGVSAEDRMFVEYAGDVGVDEPASGAYRPAVGDLVDLEGPVAQAPKDPEKTLKLDAPDAKVVSDQGAYVNADEVEQAD